MREATSIIEDDLLNIVTEGLISVQRVDFYNRGITSLRDQFCPLVTKEIKVRDDAEWYDHRWCPCTGSREGQRGDGEGLGQMPLVLFVPARRAVVKQIYTRKTEYYQHQMSQCDGDQQHTFVFLNNLMGRTLDPVMPTSSSDEELASRFCLFFRRSFALGVKLMRLLLIKSFP